tara:strand:- start:3500 stop:3778 length:279 start_codon:yes stop_codon:yes gene_type:complete
MELAATLAAGAFLLLLFDQLLNTHPENDVRHALHDVLSASVSNALMVLGFVLSLPFMAVAGIVTTVISTARLYVLTRSSLSWRGRCGGGTAE